MGSVEVILKLVHEGTGKRVAPVGAVKRQNSHRTVVRAKHADV
jgi:hypothetical protein